jgi:ribonuclease HII
LKRVKLTKNLQTPSFTEEEMLEAQGYQYIAGIDEVGRGSLAGPVVAAAVILPYHIDTPWLNQVKDSKQLSPARRESLFHHIHEVAISIGIGVIPHKVIDARGIIKATRLAMKLATSWSWFSGWPSSSRCRHPALPYRHYHKKE